MVFVNIPLEKCQEAVKPMGFACHATPVLWPEPEATKSNLGVPGWYGSWEKGLEYQVTTGNRYFNLEDIEDDRRKDFVQAITSVLFAFTITFKYTLGNASSVALQYSNKTVVNPQVGIAVGSVKWGIYSQIIPTSATQIQGLMAHVTAVVSKGIEEALPQSGSYMQEATYTNEADWAERYWGNVNYQYLLGIKRKYDPNNTFNCFHCVGGESLQQRDRNA